SRYDGPVTHKVEQLRHVPVDVASAGTHREALREGGAERELVDEARVHANYRHRAPLSTRLKNLPEGAGPVHLQPDPLLPSIDLRHEIGAMRLHADGVDAHVRAAAAGHLLQQLHEIVGFLVVDDLCVTDVARERQSLRKAVDGDDA